MAEQAEPRGVQGLERLAFGVLAPRLELHNVIRAGGTMVAALGTNAKGKGGDFRAREERSASVRRWRSPQP